MTIEINATTRWLADSAFTTYFGKPAFHAYGKGNVNPVHPAQKLLTHNINPATGRQKQEFQQVYDAAYKSGIRQTGGTRVPKIPKQKEKFDDSHQYTGTDLLPKTTKQQKQENKVKGVSIKITKPRLTIGGFVVDKKTPKKDLLNPTAVSHEIEQGEQVIQNHEDMESEEASAMEQRHEDQMDEDESQRLQMNQVEHMDPMDPE